MDGLKKSRIMDGVEVAKRKALETAVAALCIESGFQTAERETVGVLSEIMQSYIAELGRTSRMYSELSQRTEPTLSDVRQALVDAGFDSSRLLDYSKRPLRKTIFRQQKSYQQPPPRCLQVGVKVQHPSHVPAYLPAFPDPHTYIRTPAFTVPSSDYKVVREKLASQKKDSRRGLSSLLAKTRPSRPVAGKVDPQGIYTVVKSQPVEEPLYLQALMPTPEDRADVSSLKEPNSSDVTAEGGEAGEQKDEDSKDEDKLNSTLDQERALDSSIELYENPFLKLAQKGRMKSSNC